MHKDVIDHSYVNENDLLSDSCHKCQVQKAPSTNQQYNIDNNLDSNENNFKNASFNIIIGNPNNNKDLNYFNYNTANLCTYKTNISQINRNEYNNNNKYNSPLLPKKDNLYKYQNKKVTSQKDKEYNYKKTDETSNAIHKENKKGKQNYYENNNVKVNPQNKNQHVIMNGNQVQNNEVNDKKNLIEFTGDTPGGEDQTQLRDFQKERNKYIEMKNKNNINISLNIEKSNSDDFNKNTIHISLDQFKKDSLVALENVGNSTYMTAVVRIIANVKPIIIHYLNKLNDIKTKVQEIPISYALSRIVFHLYPYPQDELQNSCSVSNFHKIVTFLNPHFAGTSTKDANDFLEYLLGIMHNEDLIFKKFNKIQEKMDNTNFEKFYDYIKKYEYSIIYSTFGWINQKIKKCNNCNYSLTTYQKFYTYDIDFEGSLNKKIQEINNCNINNIVKREIHIYDCIKNLSDIEANKIINIKCEKCKQINSMKFESSIKAPPNYFIFILKANDFEIIKKMNYYHIKINIDKVINLSEIIKPQNITYNLIGFVAFYWDMQNNNKEYKAFCLSPIGTQKNWYRFDNGDKYTISKIGITSTLELNDYLPVILIYKRSD